MFRCYKCDNEVDVEASSVLVESLAFLKKALGIKAVKQGTCNKDLIICSKFLASCVRNTYPQFSTSLMEISDLLQGCPNNFDTDLC